MKCGCGKELELPTGFRFPPRVEGLVMHYLCRKCAVQPSTVPIIPQIDLYKFDPWQLPDMSLYGEKEWYFFHRGIGSTPMVQGRIGLLEPDIGRPPELKPIGKPKAVGIKKAPEFYAGKAPRGIKTNWIMHEYRLANVDRSAGKRTNSRLDDWVLCRI